MMPLPIARASSSTASSSERAAERPFLGVERSLTGRRWRDRLDAAGQQQALAIQQAHGLPDIVARVLAGRGVTAADLPGYLEPRLRDLMPDPSVLTGMEAAVARLADAVAARRRIAIFGDYDVDGACSVALLGEFLRRAGTPWLFHIPDRIIEGYGPNIGAIRALRDQGADLLVTVDCGSVSHAAIAEARALGLDTVVIDHHQAPEDLPGAVAVVNPNRQDDLSGLGHLCAAGVTFMVLVALNRALRRRGFWTGGEPDLMAMLDLVALATVADVVPLAGLNRAFVRQGIAVMRRRERLGLRALADAARLAGPPAPYHLGFLLGPRINAGGRIGDAALGARLLLTEDEAEAAAIAAKLDVLNQERQAIERAALEEAEALAGQALAADPEAPVIVVGSAGWHLGIVGLVAARLKERHRRPAFAFALDGAGGAIGSGRSVAGADLGRAVRAAVAAGMAVKGGGHAMAAGATVAAATLEAFGLQMRQALGEGVAASRADRSLAIDAALTARGISAELAAQLEAAGPFGAAQPEPVMALPAHIVVDAAVVGAGHVRLRLKAGDGAGVGAIAFRAADEPLGQALLAAQGEVLHVAGAISVDRWGGSERAELRIVDAARPEPR